MSRPKSILKRKSKYSTSGNQTTKPSTAASSRKRPTPTVAETSILASSNSSESAYYTESVSAGDEAQTNVNSQKLSSYKSSRQQPSSAKSNEENEQSNTSAKTTVVAGTHTRKTAQDFYKTPTSKTKSTVETVQKKPNDPGKSGVAPKISTAVAHGKSNKTEQPHYPRDKPETEFYKASRNTAPKIQIDNRKYPNQNQYQNEQQHQHQHTTEIPPHESLAVTQWPQHPAEAKPEPAQAQKPSSKKPAASRLFLLAKSTRRSSWTGHPSWAVKGHKVAPFGVPLPTRAKKAPPAVSQVGPLKDPTSSAAFAGGTAHSRFFPESAVEEAKCVPPKQESAPIEFYLEPQQITTKSTFADSLSQSLSGPSSIKSTNSADPPPVKNSVKSSQTPNDKSTMIEPPPAPPVELPKCQPIHETKLYVPTPIQPMIPLQVECKIVQPQSPSKEKEQQRQQQQQKPPKLQHHSTVTSETAEASSSSSSKIQKIYIKDDHTQTKHHHFKNAEDQKTATQASPSIPAEKPPFQPPVAVTNQIEQNVLSKAISPKDEATETNEIKHEEQKHGGKAKCVPKNKPVYNSPYAKKKLMESIEKDRAILEKTQEDVCQKCQLLMKKNGHPGAPASCPVDGGGGGGNRDEKTKICIIIDKGVVEKQTIEKDAKN